MMECHQPTTEPAPSKIPPPPPPSILPSSSSHASSVLSTWPLPDLDAAMGSTSGSSNDIDPITPADSDTESLQAYQHQNLLRLHDRRRRHTLTGSRHQRLQHRRVRQDNARSAQDHHTDDRRKVPGPQQPSYYDNQDALDQLPPPIEADPDFFVDSDDDDCSAGKALLPLPETTATSSTTHSASFIEPDPDDGNIDADEGFFEDPDYFAPQKGMPSSPVADPSVAVWQSARYPYRRATDVAMQSGNPSVCKGIRMRVRRKKRDTRRRVPRRSPAPSQPSTQE